MKIISAVILLHLPIQEVQLSVLLVKEPVCAQVLANHSKDSRGYELGPSCSKLTTSLVNDSLKFTSSDTRICRNFLLKNVSSFCSAKATHIFSAKNIRILYTESAKTVNEMTLNKLVKLTML